MRYNAPEQPLRVVNASDAALFARLSATGRAWLKYTKSLSDKAHSYTVPKLFLFELLPDVDVAVTLDADVIALSDVLGLSRVAHSIAHAHPHAALLHAAEQQNRYRWSLNVRRGRKQHAPPRERASLPPSSGRPRDD